jgi:hypothetical protein
MENKNIFRLEHIRGSIEKIEQSLCFFYHKGSQSTSQRTQRILIIKNKTTQSSDKNS